MVKRSRPPLSRAAVMPLVAVWLVFFSVHPAMLQAQPDCFRDDFKSLMNWRPQTFKDIDRHSTYTIETQQEGSVLKATSDNSASCLISRKRFNVYDCPVISWRWRVSKVYEQGDATTKAGDDYPLRVYVLFEYDPDQAGLAKRIKYSLVKAMYGDYPPDSSLNYIWASQQRSPDPIPNPFTDRARMIPVQSGPDRLGIWITETRHILDDYRQAFGHDPPANATLAVMNDSDNTGESSVSRLDFIQVSAAGGTSE